MVKYFNTFGIEFSFVTDVDYAPYDKYYKKNFPNDYRVHRATTRNGTNDDYPGFTYANRLEVAEAGAYANLIKAAFMRQGNYIDAQVDESAVEIPSPVFSTLAECHDFYDRMMDIVKKYPLVDHREDCYSGGGHIHWAIPNDRGEDFKVRFLLNLFRDVTNRPYLNWVFNEYCDTLSAENIMSQHDSYDHSTMNRLRCWLEGKTPKGDYYSSREPVLGCDAFSCNKGFAIRYDDGHEGEHLAKGTAVEEGVATIEFRFFDAKRSWEEVEDHVLFSNAYLNYILDLTKKGIEVTLKVHDRKDILKQVPKAEKLFKAMVTKELKLDWGTYKYYIETNLKPRRVYGEWMGQKHGND